MSDTAPSLFDQPPAPAGQPGAVELPAPAGWPAPPAPAAYHGLAGEIVQALAPCTEADPAAILAQLLIAFGAAVGRGAYYTVEATRHHPHEFVVLVGDSAKSRKGSSWDHVQRVIAEADPTLAARTLTGLSTGEGLVWAVRDSAGTDPGASDQRLLVIEPEFASVLKQTTRDINTLSPVLRSAWDGRPLALLTRTAPARSTSAHVSLIGHITATELRHHTSTVELANGFLNRHLLICCRRIRLLPEGGEHDPLHSTGLTEQLKRALGAARHAGRMRLDPAARELWWHAYQQLSAPEPGIAGQINARAEAHTIRLALIYTLINGAPTIGADQLHAALALRDYAARSARWALDPTTTDQLASEIHAALTHALPDGLTRTQLRDLYHRNQPTTRVEHALAELAAAGKITSQRVLTAGRPAELWTATQR
jgi:hypothetical protein